jgi:ribosome-associated protein
MMEAKVTKQSTGRKAPRRVAAKATKATARKVAGFALEKKASDVLVLDLRKVTDLTSFFVVCTGESGPQIKAIADNMLEQADRHGIDVYNVEGYDSLRWVLIDMIDIVVHVFQPDVRNYYQLERLWGDAPSERPGDAGSGT